MLPRTNAALLGCVCILLTASSLAPAQVTVRRPTVAVGTAGVGNRWYGGPGYNGYGYSSTPLEGAQRGMADVVRARGEAAVNASQAALTLQDAQSKHIDNKMQWAETYWERRRLNEAEQAKDQDKERARRDAWRNNRTRDVATLNPDQLDPSNGRIEWPTALKADDFDDYRRKLDELFLTRAHAESVPGLAQEINQTALAMKDALKSHIRDMPTNQYLDARKFIDGLTNANT